MSSKKAIDIFSKKEFQKRIKPIITDALVKEHDRANSLANRYKDLQEQVATAYKNCRTQAL